MTARMTENRIRRMQELESQIADLQQQVESIKTEIKSDLEEKEVDEIRTANFVIRWKEVVCSRLDSKRLKSELPEIYDQYCKSSSSRRFTIA